MPKKKAEELKEGEIIITYGEKAIVRKVETSGKGLKQGRVKCRIEAESLKDKKPIVIIRLANDLVETD
jgi:translation elongation factor P/translation initiation factor 5A